MNQSNGLMLNGFRLPEGRRIPNALFVGGIDRNACEGDIHRIFQIFGPIKLVRFVTYNRGLNFKGYGFVYFSEDVNIPMIAEQLIYLRGRRLKLGPAIQQKRPPRITQHRPIGKLPVIHPPPGYVCWYCSFRGGSVGPLASDVPGMSPAPYAPSSGLPESMVPPLPMSYAPQAQSSAHNAYNLQGVAAVLPLPSGAAPPWPGEQSTQQFNQHAALWPDEQRRQHISQNLDVESLQTLLTLL